MVLKKICLKGWTCTELFLLDAVDKETGTIAGFTNCDGPPDADSAPAFRAEFFTD